jgi:hypothetical protein
MNGLDEKALCAAAGRQRLKAYGNLLNSANPLCLEAAKQWIDIPKSPTTRLATPKEYDSE